MIVTGCCGQRFVREDLEDCPYDEDCSHCCEFLRCESCNHTDCRHLVEWKEYEVWRAQRLKELKKE